MWDIVGQKKAVSLLQKSLKKDSLAHAYLLVGPPYNINPAGQVADISGGWFSGLR